MKLYTDGSCLSNPGGPGGYCALTGSGRVVAAGGEPETTNNRMELRAAIEGLKALEIDDVEVVSDSEYLVRGATSWIDGWVARGWKTKANRPVANRDLWEELLVAIALHTAVRFRWVRGHGTDELNVLADRLAVEQALRYDDVPAWSNSTGRSKSCFGS